MSDDEGVRGRGVMMKGRGVEVMMSKGDDE
jgi:hypothetical protein